MPSGQEMEWAYSTPPDPGTKDQVFTLQHK